MKSDRLELLRSLYFPFLFVIILWIIKGIELFFDISFSFFGILPLQIKGLPGIALMPFLHGDINHLIANSLPIIILGSGLFLFYKEIAFKTFFLIWIVSGIWIWLFARGDSYHIGASGLIYGLASFHLFSGFIRRNTRLIAFSLFVIFLYGSLFWGMFPDFFPKKNISWEGHLMGALAGILFAFYFRKEGIQRETYDFNDDEDELEPQNDDESKPDHLKIVYHYKDDDKENEKN